jgi:Protein of unknown function (DUF1698)
VLARLLGRVPGAAQVWFRIRRLVARSLEATFIITAPSPQTAVDAVPIRWASKFPPPLDAVRAGQVPLFEDPRIEWAFDELGGAEGKTVLDLGPLEGAYCYMAQRAGASRVVGVEANTLAFLKCLVTKELLDLNRCSFLCGDVLDYLSAVDERFDVCIAAGILYHMVDPLRLLDLISRRAKQLFIWTHVYADEVLENTATSARLGPLKEHVYQGFSYRASRFSYVLDHTSPSFLGGTAQHSNWLLRDDLMRALDHFGWADVRLAFDDPRTPAGPALALVAERRGVDQRGALSRPR